MILKDDVAELVLRYLMANFEGENRYLAFAYAGYFKEGEYYTCFDNTRYCCWVEQAKTEEKAIKWCSGEIESTELYFS